MSSNSLLSIFAKCFLYILIILCFNVQAKHTFIERSDLKGVKGLYQLQENFKILVYDETSGFTHNSRDAARVMFSELGEIYGFEVAFDRSGAALNSLENLQKFAIVVFSNTSGNEILNNDQKNNFEVYIKGGGSFLGIHAATDTYRTGWDWYRDLVGGSVRTNPNHTDQNFPGTMDVLDADHPATSEVPDPWSRNEEWYYWKGGGGYLYSGNINLLQLRSTGDKDYDEPRPISWYKEYDGGRSFYTAMGHANSVYAEEHFRNHILGAIQWLTEDISSEPAPPTLDPIENPDPISKNAEVQSLTLTGISAGSGNIENLSITVTSSNTDLIPTPQVAYDSPSSTATLTYQPVPQKTGTAEITVTLDNGEESNNSKSQSFIIMVTDEDQPLSVTEIEDQQINLDEESEPISWYILYEGDNEIEISISSDNHDLIPPQNIVIEGNGSEKTIVITPETGQSGLANITITVKAGEHEAVSHFKVEVHNITSVNNNEQENIRIYPNPAEKEILLSLKEGNYRISIHDMAGKKLIEMENHRVFTHFPVTVSLDEIDSGIYILLIEKNKVSIRKKIIKK